VPVRFFINGRPRAYDGNPNQPLLWHLRDELDMTGTRFGCGMGVCGCCTVMMGDAAVRSCVTPISALEDARITTIEGLGSPGNLHPLQAAWIENAVPQCGYCQSGQIMQAAALLRATPSPTDSDIDGAMAGNLCRCGTYPRVRKAIHEAAIAIVRKAKAAA